NLHVMTGARVSRIVFQNRRAEGVAFRLEGGGEQVARARAEVILAAGAIGSPQLLQVSGIGPAALLQARGIPVLHDLPGVGENLQDHLQLRMIYRVTGAKTLNAM